MLVFIHADAAPNRSASCLLVRVLSNSLADPYLSQAVLNLQLGHSQLAAGRRAA